MNVAWATVVYMAVTTQLVDTHVCVWTDTGLILTVVCVQVRYRYQYIFGGHCIDLPVLSPWNERCTRIRIHTAIT